MSVYDSTLAEIESLAAQTTAPGLAAGALALAAAIDGSKNATATANAARELRMMLGELRDLAPVGNANDSLDALAKRREARRRAS